MGAWPGLEGGTRQSADRRGFLSGIALPGFLLRFPWVQICAGWILATLFVGGITGPIRRD